MALPIRKLTSALSPASVREFTRRTMHGATGWVAGSVRDTFYQPQDQVSELDVPTVMADHMRKLSGEPDDARLTGGTRSLMRRLSGLNLGVRPPVATTVPRAA